MSDLRAKVEALPLYDPHDRITAMNGTVREPRTMADAAEAMKSRVLDLIPEGVVLVTEESLAAALTATQGWAKPGLTSARLAAAILRHIREASDGR